MTEHTEELTAACGRLNRASIQISNTYQSAVRQLEELEQALPRLIASIALEETDAGKLDEVRQEISRLRIITKEPYPQAIKIIDAKKKLISEQIDKAVGYQAAIDQERAYREHFNHCLETHSRTNGDWQRLRGAAQHWHLKDINLLDSLHYEFDNKGYHYLPGSPTFAEFAASKGLPLYNLDVTFENITQPKERQTQ